MRSPFLPVPSTETYTDALCIRCLGFGILSIAYGIDIEKEKTPYMAIAAETMATFAATFVPGKYLVETFPSLRFLPSWLPGARFKREGKAWKPIVERLRNTPWDATVAAMVCQKYPHALHILLTWFARRRRMAWRHPPL